MVLRFGRRWYEVVGFTEECVGVVGLNLVLWSCECLIMVWFSCFLLSSAQFVIVFIH